MSRSTRIILCFRTPVGGLFRHVCDLTRGLARRGTEVGIVCDSLTGGQQAAETLAELEHVCALGVRRVEMPRAISPLDLPTALAIRDWCGDLRPDIIHGHGAKGGVFARLAAWRLGARAYYTPHGGSLHYDPRSLEGMIYFRVERSLERLTDGIIFESEYGERTYREKIGVPRCPARIIHNGLAAADFAPVRPASGAADFVYVGDLRRLKGVDVLIDALRLVAERRPVSAVIVGSGEDAEAFRQQAAQAGPGVSIRFAGAMPARRAFALGKVLVVPSRNESLPYIVLEAAGAGMPVIATRAGGIGEIFGDFADALVPPGDPAPLAAAMLAALADPEPLAAQTGALLARTRERFNVERMVDDILAFYGDGTHAARAVAAKASSHRAAPVR